MEFSISLVITDDGLHFSLLAMVSESVSPSSGLIGNTPHNFLLPSLYSVIKKLSVFASFIFTAFSNIFFTSNYDKGCCIINDTTPSLLLLLLFIYACIDNYVTVGYGNNFYSFSLSCKVRNTINIICGFSAFGCNI